jgi:hypothetical protein
MYLKKNPVEWRVSPSHKEQSTDEEVTFSLNSLDNAEK